MDLPENETPTNPNPNPNPIPAPAVNTKKPGFNFLPVLIVVVAGVLLLTGGFLLYQTLYSTKTPETSTTKTSTSSAKTSTPSAQKDATADWKTFISKVGKFEVKYPSSSNISTEGSDVAYLAIGDGIPDPMFIVLVKTGSDSRLTPSANSKAVKIDGEDALLYESNDTAATKSYILKRGELIYVIELSWTKDSDKNQLEQILSTFKFTN